MAAYYTASRRHCPPAPASSASHPSSRSRHPSITLTDSPTYIFPDPSSTPPSSPSSHFSEWSDISSSVISFSDIGSTENSPLLSLVGRPAILDSRQPLSPPESLDSWTDVQGLGQNRRERWLVDSIPPEPVANIPDEACGGTANSDAPHTCLSVISETIPSRPSKTVIPLIPGNKRQQSPVLQQAPLVHSSIPLLSFFASLLGVDDSTLDLLTLPTSSASISFPTEKGFDVAALNGMEAPILHGVEKLCSATQAEMGYHHGLLSLGEVPTIRPVVAPRVRLVITAFVSNGCKLLYHFSGRLTQTIQNSRMN